MNSPTVFISYSYETPKHADRVLDLSNRLRSDGVDCTVDQYEDSPPAGWTRWMDRQIEKSDFVIMICTETYCRRVMGEEKPGRGRGVKWEGKLIYQHIYKDDMENTRFIPALFKSGKVEYIPTPLQDATYYCVDTEQGYEDLYRRLTDQPRFRKPRLGKLKELPPRERKRNFLAAEATAAKVSTVVSFRTQMIGRTHEFAELRKAITRWLQGQGQITSIIGDAGVGKSRMIDELHSFLDSGQVPSSVLCLEGRCIPQSTSYKPFLDILRAYFDLSKADNNPTSARKVTTATTDLFPNRAAAILPFLGHLLSIRFGNQLDDIWKIAARKQDPIEHQMSMKRDPIEHQMLMRLRDFFKRLGKRQPLLLILEDLHCGDSLSLELISLLMDELATTPLMMLCAYRPETEHPAWKIRDEAEQKCPNHYTEISLEPLSRSDSEQLVKTLLKTDNPPESIMKIVLQKSGDNPFYIEEIIRSLIEQDRLHEEDHWKGAPGTSDIDVPDTIQNVVSTRMARLEPKALHVLRFASVIGWKFRHKLLRQVTPGGDDLDRYLAELEEREFIYRNPAELDTEYVFKHQLTQEAIYKGIPEKQNRMLHGQAGDAIESIYRERLEDYYEELARHYSNAIPINRKNACSVAEKAVGYLLKAGNKAKNCYTNETAISHFKKARVMMEQYGMERNEWKLDALRGLGEVYFRIGENSKSENMFRKAISLAKRESLYSSRELVRLHYWIAETLHWQEQYDKEIQCARMGLEILDSDTHCLEAALMNGKIADGNIGKGNIEEHRKYIYKNMAFVRDLTYSVELRSAYVNVVSLFVNQKQADLEVALDWAVELEKRAGRYSDLRGLASAWALQGTIYSSRGDLTNSLESRQKSLEMYERIGDANLARGAWGAISELLLRSGHIDKAEKHVQRYLQMSCQIGNSRYIASAHYLQGGISMCLHRWEDALIHFQEFNRVSELFPYSSALAGARRRIGTTYLQKGDPHRSLQYFEEAFREVISSGVIAEDYTYDIPVKSGIHKEIRPKIDNTSLPTKPSDLGTLSGTLGGLEEAYRALNMTEDFAMFCRSFKEQHAEMLKNFPLHQWYLEPAIPSPDFSFLAFSDHFDSIIEVSASQKQDSTDRIRIPKNEKLSQAWCWISQFKDCFHKFVGASEVEIHAANGRGLNVKNMSAPRLMRAIHGDFAMEVCIAPVSNEKPQMGGLLVLQDTNSFLRFEKGAHRQHEILLHGYVNGKWQIAGRGLLPLGVKDKPVYLRLERVGQQFTAYCSTDETNWLTCGKMALPTDGHVQIGVHSLGMIDRTHYCGAFKEGTATAFCNFKVWTRC